MVVFRKNGAILQSWRYEETAVWGIMGWEAAMVADSRTINEQDRIALAFIKQHKVVSIFWITANQRRACAVQRLQDSGVIERMQKDRRDRYPYCVFKIRKDAK